MSVKFIFKRYKYEFETIKDDINEKKRKRKRPQCTTLTLMIISLQESYSLV